MRYGNPLGSLSSALRSRFGSVHLSAGPVSPNDQADRRAPHDRITQGESWLNVQPATRLQGVAGRHPLRLGATELAPTDRNARAPPPIGAGRQRRRAGRVPANRRAGSAPPGRRPGRPRAPREQRRQGGQAQVSHGVRPTAALPRPLSAPSTATRRPRGRKARLGASARADPPGAPSKDWCSAPPSRPWREGPRSRRSRLVLPPARRSGLGGARSICGPLAGPSCTSRHRRCRT